MARSKFTPGSKANRTNPSQHQTDNSNLPEVSAVVDGATPAEVAAAEINKTPEPRKMEVVRSEPRKNAAPPIPINLEDEIRRRAYELYQQRGNASGSEAEDWLTAEREIKQRYRQQQSA
ncbi:MAG: DUF2934 domain-containing protein [Candidatus Sulfotelmatobacter sp.]